MEKLECWKVFQCKKAECPAYKSKNQMCWLSSGTYCRDEIQRKFLEKMEMCLDCEIFKVNDDVDAMKETIMVLSRQIKESKQAINNRDRELEGMSLELALGLSEVFEALKKIASGDPTVRIDETSEVELISRLKHIINQTAENIGEIVDQSHEFAMVLTEHFDVLHKLSKGDLNARISGSSQIEPLESLKKLTNQMIESMSDEITEMKEKEKKIIKSRDAFLNMLKEIDVSYKKLKNLYESLLYSFVNALDAKSPWTKGHSVRVTNYVISIAKEMGLKNKDIENLKTAALLHDIGKIGTYDVILDKPDRLTAEEFALVKMHPAKGEEILKPISQLKKVLPIVRYHHERIDGKGYPDGLKGDEIPLCARIVHVADSFDSMTADRPYRPAPGKEYAISELKMCSGTQFDPKVVEAFLKILGNLTEENIRSNNMY